MKIKLPSLYCVDGPKCRTCNTCWLLISVLLFILALGALFGCSTVRRCEESAERFFAEKNAQTASEVLR